VDSRTRAACLILASSKLEAFVNKPAGANGVFPAMSGKLATPAEYFLTTKKGS
jgi:hypothetical protein